MMALGTLLRKPPLPPGGCRAFWGWLNAVFNKQEVDHERIQAVGPDRAASEWLLRCGALVRYQGSPKWQQDYNGLPTGPRGKYKIEAINATDSCIMYRGFDYLGNAHREILNGFHSNVNNGAVFSFLSKMLVNHLWFFSPFTNIYQSLRFCWRCGMKWKDINFYQGKYHKFR